MFSFKSSSVDTDGLGSALKDYARKFLSEDQNNYIWLDEKLGSAAKKGTRRVPVEFSHSFKSGDTSDGQEDDEDENKDEPSFALAAEGSARFTYFADPNSDQLLCDAPSTSDGHTPVLLQFEGELAAGAKGGLPISLGTFTGRVSGNVSASLQSTLQFVFEKPNDKNALKAGLASLKQLPEPWDLSEVSKRSSLVNISLDNAKHLSAGMSVALSRGLDIKSIKGEISLDAGVSFALAGLHKICLTRISDEEYLLSVENQDTSKRGFSTGFSVTLDLQPIIKKGLETVEDALGPQKDLLDVLKNADLIRPGDKAKALIEAAIKDTIDDAEVRTVLNFASGKGTADNAQKALSTLIENRLDLSPETLFGGDIKPTVERITSEVFDRMPFPAAAGQLRKRLSDIVEEALTALKADAHAELDKLTSELIKPLAKLGTSIDAAASDANALAAAIRPHVEDYAVLLRNLTKAAEDAALAKLQLKLGIEADKTVGDQAEAVIRLDPSEKSAQRFCNQVFLGDLTPLVALVKGTSSASRRKGVSLVSGRLKSWTRVTKGSSLGISFLGLSFKSSGSVAARASWEVDRSGNIASETISAGVEAKYQSDAGGEIKLMSFLNAQQFAAVGTDDTDWSAGFGLRYDDPALDPEEIGHVIQQFLQAGLIDEDRSSELQEAYATLPGNKPGHFPRARLLGHLAVSGDALRRFMEEGPGADGTWRAARLTFAKAVLQLPHMKGANTTLNMLVNRGWFLDRLPTGDGPLRPKNEAELSAQLSMLTDGRLSFLSSELGGLTEPYARGTARSPYLELLFRLNGLGMALAAMHTSWAMKISNPTWSNRHILEARLANIQERIGEGILRGLTAREPMKVFTMSDIFSPAGLALFTTFARLTETDLDEHFKVTLEPLPEK